MKKTNNTIDMKVIITSVLIPYFTHRFLTLCELPDILSI